MFLAEKIEIIKRNNNDKKKQTNMNGTDRVECTSMVDSQRFKPLTNALAHHSFGEILITGGMSCKEQLA